MLRALKRRRLRKPAPEPPAPSFKVSLMLAPEDWMAGNKPNSRPVRSASAKLKPSTRQSNSTVKKSKVFVYEVQNCALSLGRNFIIKASPQCATSTPSAPPSKDRRMLSVINWRISLKRAAPSHRARQQQVGRVGAGDQERQPDGGE